MPLPRQPYQLTNVLVAGRRLSGTALGTNEADAVRRFAAKQARRLGADVEGAMAGALAAKGYKATTVQPVQAVADQLLVAPDRDWSDWPAMRESQDAQLTPEQLNALKLDVDELNDAAAVDDRIMNFYCVVSHDRYLELKELRVDPDVRGQGVGSEYVKRVTDLADRYNVPVVLMPEHEPRHKADLQRFYRRHGFFPNRGRNKRYDLGGCFGGDWRYRQKPVTEAVELPKPVYDLGDGFTAHVAPWKPQYSAQVPTYSVKVKSATSGVGALAAEFRISDRKDIYTDEQGAPTYPFYYVLNAYVYPLYRGRGLYRRFIKAFAKETGPIRSDINGHTTLIADRAWKAVGARRVGIQYALGEADDLNRVAQDLIKRAWATGMLDDEAKYSGYQVDLVIDSDESLSKIKYAATGDDEDKQAELSRLIDAELQRRDDAHSARRAKAIDPDDPLSHVAQSLKGTTWEQAKRILVKSGVGYAPSDRRRRDKITDEAAAEVWDFVWKAAHGAIKRWDDTPNFPRLSELGQDVNGYRKLFGSGPVPERVMVYRGVPRPTKIRPGDFVTMSRDFARSFKRTKYGTVVKDELPADDLLVYKFDDADNTEFVYWPRGTKPSNAEPAETFREFWTHNRGEAREMIERMTIGDTLTTWVG